MRLVLVTLTAPFTVVLLLAIVALPVQALGQELIDTSNKSGRDKYDSDRVVFSFTHDVLKKEERLTTEVVDATCSNACDADQMNHFRAPFAVIKVESVDDKGVNGRVGAHFANGKSTLVARWINRIFLSRRNRKPTDDHRERYLLPTESIVPLLLNSSSKTKSLVDLIRLEGVNNNVSSDFVNVLYDLSVENMESVVAVLDFIISDVEANATIDFQRLSCHMLQITTLLQDVTLPNIEWMAQTIYSNSSNTEMVHRINEYNEEKAAATRPSLSSPAKRHGINVCLAYNMSSAEATTNAKIFSSCMGSDCVYMPFFDPAEVAANVLIVITYVLLFPISIVISLISIIVTILLLPALSLVALLLFPPSGDTSAELIFIFVVLTLLALIFAPVAIILNIVASIISIFDIILTPLFPNKPNKVSSSAKSTFPPYYETPTTGLALDENIGILMHRLSVVLESPLQMVAAVFQNETMVRHADQNDLNSVECEIVSFVCKSNALLDVLPF